MRLLITNYLDVISSWCFWATPAWQELQKRYADRVDFQWKIALMDKTGLPPTQAHMEWFYRRSGTLMRSPVMLQTSWHEVGREEYPEPNCVAEAARELGVADDRADTQPEADDLGWIERNVRAVLRVRVEHELADRRDPEAGRDPEVGGAIGQLGQGRRRAARAALAAEASASIPSAPTQSPAR